MVAEGGARRRVEYEPLARGFYTQMQPRVPAASHLSSSWPYSFAATNPTTFDSDCICRTILPTSSFGSLVSERRMR